MPDFDYTTVAAMNARKETERLHALDKARREALGAVDRRLVEHDAQKAEALEALARVLEPVPVPSAEKSWWTDPPQAPPPGFSPVPRIPRAAAPSSGEVAMLRDDNMRLHRREAGVQTALRRLDEVLAAMRADLAALERVRGMLAGA